MKRPIYWIADNRVSDRFPAASQALSEPDGLLAVGGDLDSATLLEAYRGGIFPWYVDGQPILWWSPDPRTVLFPDELRVTRSLRKTLRRGHFRISFDESFDAVIAACGAPRGGDPGTWLTSDMISAYQRLHREGYAHSVECWHEGALVGGLYGVAIGQVFFGESMFSRMSDASKACLAHLVEHVRTHDFLLIDCQVHSPHLETLGCRRIPRSRYLALLAIGCAKPDAFPGVAKPARLDA